MVSDKPRDDGSRTFLRHCLFDLRRFFLHQSARAALFITAFCLIYPRLVERSGAVRKKTLIGLARKFPVSFISSLFPSLCKPILSIISLRPVVEPPSSDAVAQRIARLVPIFHFQSTRRVVEMSVGRWWWLVIVLAGLQHSSTVEQGPTLHWWIRYGPLDRSKRQCKFKPCFRWQLEISIRNIWNGNIWSNPFLQHIDFHRDFPNPNEVLFKDSSN